MGLELIDIRAILLDPVDLRGLPRIDNNGFATWCTPGFLPQKGKGILFLDELNAAPPLVQAACYQLILDRKLGEYELPEGWSIIAAGNGEKDRSVTHRMPSALANRFVHLNFSVDVEDWIKWAAQNCIAPEVISFIRFRPRLLHDFDPERDSKTFASPRSWEFISGIVASNPDPAVLKDLFQGTIGYGAATEFSAFLKIWQDLPGAEEILENPDTIEIPKDPAMLFAICEMLPLNLDVNKTDQMMIFASRLPAEFSVLLMGEAVRNQESIVNSSAFTTWASQHCEVLV